MDRVRRTRRLRREVSRGCTARGRTRDRVDNVVRAGGDVAVGLEVIAKKR